MPNKPAMAAPSLAITPEVDGTVYYSYIDELFPQRQCASGRSSNRGVQHEQNGAINMQGNHYLDLIAENEVYESLSTERRDPSPPNI